ncbi:trypsin-1-like [Copidosoma floridanum]|uniref:trypsin-1-like n=1 Tax=Copidosoma floridanum TaxID=29053 RepID=UPI000C6FAF89|nr:trypsin-1-like [Copidosoma floridanum]
MAFKLALVSCLLALCSAKPHGNQGALPSVIDSYQNPWVNLGLPLSSRIVGGQEADRGEFPHQVSLQYGYGMNLRHLCGGSIISHTWILTAAHCPKAVPGRTLHVKAGKHSIRTTEKTEQLVKVAQVFTHEKYPNGVAPYDIALLKLERPLVFGELVQPIGLPAPDSQVTSDVVLSGWGSVTSNGFGSPEFLQKVTLPIVDNESCKKAIEALTGSAPVAPSNVCTGPLTGGVSACSGDSGGPLIKVHEDGRKEVVGIVSWGVLPCGTLGAPSVYTRVSSYIDWIANIMKNN